MAPLMGLPPEPSILAPIVSAPLIALPGRVKRVRTARERAALPAEEMERELVDAASD
jgi:hypothetical protein